VIAYPVRTGLVVMGLLASVARQAGVSDAGPRPLHKGHVDISKGLYIREDDDLVVPTPFPMVLRRTYLSGYRVSREFGIGTTHTGQWFLIGDNNPRIPWAELILADGGRIHLARISPGDSQETAVLKHVGTPTIFNGALMRWNSSKWVMQLQDGSQAVFLDCQAADEVCLLIERADAHGNRITYVREHGKRLDRMESADQRIMFEYDSHDRITSVSDSSRRRVTYAYDDRGRLVTASGSDGVIRRYAYDDGDQLIEVREPGRIVANTFDPSGRLVKQVVKDSDGDDDPYVTTLAYTVEDGSVTRTDIGEDDGTTSVYRFNRSHYVISQTLDADGLAPVTMTIDRDDATNAARAVSVSCRNRLGPVSQTFPLTLDINDVLETGLSRLVCGRY
jgi:YD repeat-containing protein